MLEKENVESEKYYAHNNKGERPSSFNDVTNRDVRHANRGAILANIFERYTTETPQGNKQLLPKDFAMMTREMDNYLSGIPRHEKGKAKESMMEHLKERGYRES